MWYLMNFEVLMAVNFKIMILWDVRWICTASTLKIEAAGCFKTLTSIYKSTQYQISQDPILNSNKLLGSRKLENF
jgi:hypothetical protein